MVITPFYAALFGLVFLALSVRALRIRRRHQVPIGDGGSPELLRAVRAHANFAEYVPLTLLLVVFVEIRLDSAVFVHGLCVALLAGRLVHAIGVSRIDEDYRLRVVGMALTLSVLGLAALAVLFSYRP